MPRYRDNEDDDDTKPKEPPIPVEPNGHDLTRRRAQQADTLEKMQKVADEIASMLHSEQRRQKYRNKGDTDGDGRNDGRRR